MQQKLATDEGPGAGALLAAGCGAALASVCAIGLFHLRDTLGGAWSLAAVLVAGLLCAVLAQVFTRLSAVVPSGAGILAFLSRAYGRRAGLALTLPYLVFTLALVGIEARIVGYLLSRVLPLPPLAGAVAFLVATWAVCRRGVRPGYRAQAAATWALVTVLVALALAALMRAAAAHTLSARLLPAAPSLSVFVAGVGQALFLFMGFELLTSQAQLGRKPVALGRALRGSVLLLAAVYGVVALGFCVMDGTGAVSTDAWLAPQLAIAERAGGTAGVLVVVVVGLLASFTSFNGVLLALSRLLAALAGQGMLPRGLARMDATRLVPQRALALLFALALAATLAIDGRRAALGVIAGAAAAAALVYAASACARERAPFVEAARSRWRRAQAVALALLLLLFGIGALRDVLVIDDEPTPIVARAGAGHGD